MTVPIPCAECRRLTGHRPDCSGYRQCWLCLRSVLDGRYAPEREGKHHVIRWIGPRKSDIYLCDDHLKAEGMTPSDALNHHRAVEID